MTEAQERKTGVTRGQAMRPTQDAHREESQTKNRKASLSSGTGKKGTTGNPTY